MCKIIQISFWMFNTHRERPTVVIFVYVVYSTTWDEHIIEISLSKPASLGHIDFRFTMNQQCANPLAIQVTLLKQNSSSFGYRMKSKADRKVQSETHSNAAPAARSAAPGFGPVGSGRRDMRPVDEAISFNEDWSSDIGKTTNDLCSSFKYFFEYDINVMLESAADNPVLKDDFLQLHNADIISGPHDLASCMNLNEQGGLLTLTSPRLFKTKSRNFLIHIKTINDLSAASSAAINTRTVLSTPQGRRKGILRYLFPAVGGKVMHDLTGMSQLTSAMPGGGAAPKNTNKSKGKVSTSQQTYSIFGNMPASQVPKNIAHYINPVGGAHSFGYTQDQSTNTMGVGLGNTASAMAAANQAGGSTARQRTMAAANSNMHGWDWLSEVHVTLRNVKAVPAPLRLPNERYQRMAMIESMQFLHELLRLASVPANAQQKHLALDLLLWVIVIRMSRFRSPKSSKSAAAAASFGSTADTKAKPENVANPSGTGTATTTPPQRSDYASEMAQQQRNCAQAVQQHLVELLRHCILYGNRTTASKCVKILLVVTE